MTTLGGESSGADPLLSLLRDQIQAQHAVSAAINELRTRFELLGRDMDGMRRIAENATKALDRASEVEAARLTAMQREEKREEQRYNVVGRVVQSPWAMALGGGLVAWLLQRLGVAVDTASSTAPTVQP